MSKKLQFFTLLFICLILVVFLYFGFSVTSKAVANQNSNLPQKQIKIFSEVLNIVQSDYVEKIPTSKLIIDAIKGMVSSLDPHSEFLTPQEYKNMQTTMKGHFGGIGIVIDKKDNFLTVVSPLPGTPAYKAGIKANDVILKINNISTFRMSLEKAVKLMRGKPGTYIKLTIARKGVGQPLIFKLKRAIIHIKNIDTKLFGDIGYIKIIQFRDHTASELNNALSKLEKKHIKGLILDLRNNPGGLLNEAAKVSNMFINKGVIVSIKGRNPDNDQTIYAKDKPIFKKPLVVLINSGTASAAEIVTGCLKDHNRAIVIGQRSFGKGNVQDVIPLKGGYALILTVAKYYTPNGFSIQAEGIVPNIEIKKKNEDEFVLRENELLHHLTSKKAILQKPQEILIDNNTKEPKHLKNEFIIKQAIKVLNEEIQKCPQSAKACYSYLKS
ncbi:MAG: S41 family peptidase [Desulfurella sp.]|uniref:S41 family peptidase n=1 Tax=Desulfurella TaxID=33001 RepID=UPI000CA72DAC|nr:MULTISPECIES: S41 family peptidase [Desulfurella]PMP67782.1 MAG: peptidase S41 [Desulfurella multipotens]PMP92636.1 MAG: peptidase S41 [Desulfurella sp.]